MGIPQHYIDFFLVNLAERNTKTYQFSISSPHIGILRCLMPKELQNLTNSVRPLYNVDLFLVSFA